MDHLNHGHFDSLGGSFTNLVWESIRRKITRSLDNQLYWYFSSTTPGSHIEDKEYCDEVGNIKISGKGSYFMLVSLRILLGATILSSLQWNMEYKDAMISTLAVPIRPIRIGQVINRLLHWGFYGGDFM